MLGESFKFLVCEPPESSQGRAFGPSKEFLRLEEFLLNNPDTWVKLERPQHSSVGSHIRKQLTRRNPNLLFAVTTRKTNLTSESGKSYLADIYLKSS